MKKLINIIILFVVFIAPACNRWKSFDGKSESQVLKIAYKEGYICGKQFGNMDQSSMLENAAFLTYIGQINSKEDSLVRERFKEQFIKGMESGVNESPYKEFVIQTGECEMVEVIEDYVEETDTVVVIEYEDSNLII